MWWCEDHFRLQPWHRDPQAVTPAGQAVAMIEGRKLSDVMAGKKPPQKRANKAVVVDRVCTLTKELIRGSSRKDLRRIAAGWDVSERQMERYIAAAVAELEKRAKYSLNYEFGKNAARLESLYLEAEKKGDVRTRLAVIKQICDMFGLNAPSKTEISGSLTASAEWIELRGVLIKVLGEYPDAKQAVLAAITEKTKEN
jgi:hypothetical protein